MEWNNTWALRRCFAQVVTMVTDKNLSHPSVKIPLSSSPPPGYVYAQQPQVVVMQQPVLGNPPGDQFVMSLFTVFCCFMPLGLIALIKSIEARNAYQSGRLEDAAAATQSAKTFNKLSIIINIIIIGFVLLLQLTWIIPNIIVASRY